MEDCMIVYVCERKNVCEINVEQFGRSHGEGYKFWRSQVPSH